MKRGVLACIAVVACSSGSTGNQDTCGPPEADGTKGGHSTLVLEVNDVAFSPAVLKADNLATVTLTFTNTGTKPHGFAVRCMPTPNGNGCPSAACFPDAAKLGPIAPGASVTTTFVTPNP